MPTLTMPATSCQFVQQQVLATLGGSSYDPSADPVFLAFVLQPQYGPTPSPSSGQWNAATWEVDAGPTYWASALVGPANGGVVLAQGVYQIFVKVTDNPAIPVLTGWSLLISA